MLAGFEFLNCHFWGEGELLLVKSLHLNYAFNSAFGPVLKNISWAINMSYKPLHLAYLAKYTT